MSSIFNIRLLESVVGSVRTTPQTRQIASHLKTVGDISGVEAATLYKARSLTRRIADLRDAGVSIKSERKRDVTGQRYVRYVLA
ncbi:MAG: helix-turn-helix domain-containing protein [Solimonas sp.]